MNLLAIALATVLVNVDLSPQGVANKLVPMESIGAGLDAENPGSIGAIYGRADVSQMLASGLGPVTYRLYTELGVQAWHWNPAGSWSASNRRGYFTGSSALGAPIVDSYGYGLPHRGFTHDQANDDGYSRLDDGNPQTYWKSNPYLTKAYTHDADEQHPQWVLFDLGSRKNVDAIRIVWKNPFAVAYRVQYWTGSDALYSPADGSRWATFAGGAVDDGMGGSATLELSRMPRPARYVRVLMTQSSQTCDENGEADPRNCLGYAIGEIGIGTMSGSAFHDLVRHAANGTQTVTYASSVDPWHAAGDRDRRGQVQPGLDEVFQSGVTRGLPTLVPVAMLYGTPQDAVAELRYLRARGDALRGIELGEEPDGQFASPEDYGALYVQWARALHAVAPNLPLGGPVFQGSTGDVKTWPNASGDASWLRRFLQYLSAHRALGELGFMSFEHYPFGACSQTPYANVREEPRRAAGILDVWRRDGLPSGVPMMVTEMNFSANAGAVFQDVPGALWFADAVGAFLTNGALATYLYQYAPEPMQRTTRNCATWGSYGMFTATQQYAVRQRTAQFFAAQLLMLQWAQPRRAAHVIYRTRQFSLGPPGANDAVSSYAILRPDGTYAVMLVNKDPFHAIDARVEFSAGGRTLQFTGKLTEALFGERQYAWHGDGRNAYAQPDGPAEVRAISAAVAYSLEPGSITVLRGSVK